MDWLKQFDVFVQGLIIVSMIIPTLFLSLIIVYFININFLKKNIKQIYGFTSGFLIITAIVGLFVTGGRDSLFRSLEYFQAKQEHNDVSIDHEHSLSFSNSLIVMSVFLSGIIIGTFLGFMIKKYSLKINHSHSVEQEKHTKNHLTKGHSHILDTRAEIIDEFKKDKKAFIYMILTHRMPAGLTIGFLIINLNNGGEFASSILFAFILHIIPEIVITYIAKLKTKSNRKNSLKFAFLTQLIIIPFIFIAISIGHFGHLYDFQNHEKLFWILPLFLIISGILMIWASIFELGPAFVHVENTKETYKLILSFVIGLTTSMLIQIIHVH